ncbi:MAG: type II secretion system F family protein [Gammaproteobacteria bacterium]|nr:type II secretion system F family protein [Gammaproteobacteria bacterium]
MKPIEHMPLHQKTFTWKGINILGKKVSGEIKAHNKATAISELKNQSIFFIKIHQKNSFTFYFTSKKIPPLMLVFFFRQLATLLCASVPIVQSLTILQKMNNHIIFQKMITAIKYDLESGKLLSFSLQKFLYYFDNITCQLIHVGEQSGTLATILKRIATQKEHNFQLKKQVIQSLIYPGIILCIAILVNIIMLTFVVPRFAELFKTMHGTLPTLTLIVIALSHFMQDYSGVLFLLLVSLILLFKYVKQLHLIKQKIDHFILTLPFIGIILSKIILARFARYLAISLNAGIPIAQSLKMMGNIFGNLHYENIISELRTEISKGQSLHQAMQKYSHFPIMLVQMVKTGEESGTLEEMLEKIAEIYEFDASHLITNITHTLEPLIMIILGVLIGGLVIAMYLPIFKLGTLM